MTGMASESQQKKFSFLEWFMNFDFYRKFLLPGFVLQSVVIAGGYGTGREIVEYFMQYGPKNGLLGMFFVTTILWAAVCAASFEFARLFRTYDYRSFFKHLIGGAWPLYEICYIILLFIVLGVCGAASGSILKETFNLPPLAGAGVFLLLIALLTYFGSRVIAAALSWWSFFLYIVYIVFLVLGFMKFSGNITESLSSGVNKPGWVMGGFQYAFYNLGCLPAILFVTRFIETRKEAIISGIFAGLLTILPGFFLYIVLLGAYPDVLTIEVPTYFALQRIGLTSLLITYMIVLFGTMIETGTGFIHAVNERINSYMLDKKGREISRTQRGAIGFVMALLGLLISSFGLIPLIARGYGTISWGFFILHGVALFTIGIYKIVKAKGKRVHESIKY
jgi:uncharacterized membrane protein YkvI